MTKNPKNKGSSFERKVAKELSLWWSHGERQDIFYRTHSSGAIGTIHNKTTKGNYSTECGDIMAIDPVGQAFTDVFTLELKRGYQYDIIDFLHPTKKNMLFKFWSQVEADRKKSGSMFSMLILKQDRKPTLVMITSECLSVLCMCNNSIAKKRISLRENNSLFLIFNYVQFFEWLEPETVVMINERNQK